MAWSPSILFALLSEVGTVVDPVCEWSIRVNTTPPTVSMPTEPRSSRAVPWLAGEDSHGCRKVSLHDLLNPQDNQLWPPSPLQRDGPRQQPSEPQEPTHDPDDHGPSPSRRWVKRHGAKVDMPCLPQTLPCKTKDTLVT